MRSEGSEFHAAIAVDPMIHPRPRRGTRPRIRRRGVNHRSVHAQREPPRRTCRLGPVRRPWTQESAERAVADSPPRLFFAAATRRATDRLSRRDTRPVTMPPVGEPVRQLRILLFIYTSLTVVAVAAYMVCLRILSVTVMVFQSKRLKLDAQGPARLCPEVRVPSTSGATGRKSCVPPTASLRLKCRWPGRAPTCRAVSACFNAERLDS